MTTRLSRFRVPKMGCAAEEQMVRHALEPVSGIRQLRFDLPGRGVDVYHEGDVGQIEQRLSALGLGSALQSSGVAALPAGGGADDRLERRTLVVLLAINAVMFVVEQVAGWIAASVGLLADSLDMLADASVYGIALYAVGRSAHLKLSAARLSGWLQLVLALGILVEVARRFVLGSQPDHDYMMTVALCAPRGERRMPGPHIASSRRRRAHAGELDFLDQRRDRKHRRHLCRAAGRLDRFAPSGPHDRDRHRRGRGDRGGAYPANALTRTPMGLSAGGDSDHDDGGFTLFWQNAVLTFFPPDEMDAEEKS